MTGEIVPFGKYKGKPIEALAQDRSYVDWMTQQPGIVDRYPEIIAALNNVNVTIINNNFAEPSATPEHNRVQAKFLDDDFIMDILRRFNIVRPGRAMHIRDKRFEVSGNDVVLLLNTWDESNDEMPNFRAGGIRVEVKPTIGDDYPAVLRQATSAGSCPQYSIISNANDDGILLPSRSIVYTEEYTGSVPAEQVIEMFRLSGSTLIIDDQKKNLSFSTGPSEDQ